MFYISYFDRACSARLPVMWEWETMTLLVFEKPDDAERYGRGLFKPKVLQYTGQQFSDSRPTQTHMWDTRYGY